jgi:hypothetical protein
MHSYVFVAAVNSLVRSTVIYTFQPINNFLERTIEKFEKGTRSIRRKKDNRSLHPGTDYAKKFTSRKFRNASFTNGCTFR